MANYQRYQTLSSAEQYLFSPSCPVWVQKYQLSWDVQTGSRLLQCRMVNVSQKALTAVYLRVLCRDEQGQDLTMLHLVPVTGLFVTPGAVFGDDKVVTLWPKRVAYAEIFPERVCFSDGTAWNEPMPSDYTAIPAPSPVRTQDPAYPRLAAAAREGGVRNDVYFRALKQVWICTCGLPNGNAVLRCRHCGADRTWLEQHMDAQALSAPEHPAAPKPAEQPAPEPELREPLEKFDLASYLTAEPLHSPVPAQEEFPEIPTQAEPEPEQKKRHTGRTVAIILAILLFLGAGAWVGYRQLLRPYLRYQEAYAAEENGDYARAIELYRALGAYQDSAERIAYCEGQIALDLMREGRYAEAYEQLRAMPGYESYAADCLYSQGVLAYNNGDLDTAWHFVAQLQAEAPTYESLPQLHDCCCYGFGKQLLDQAGETLDDPFLLISVYEEAKNWFVQAGTYSNSADMVTLCDYYIASQTENAGKSNYDSAYLLEAVNRFAALGEYSNSQERRLDCMFEYAQMEQDPENETTVAFLEELMDEGYRGAEELYDELFRMEVTVDVLQSEPTNSVLDREHMQAVGTSISLTQMEQLYVLYSVEGGRDENVTQILMIYTLPGSPAGSVTLNPDGGRSGTVLLYGLIPVKAAKDGDVKLQFYDAKTGAELKSVAFKIAAEDKK